MRCDVTEATEEALLILQPLRRVTYVTGTAPTSPGDLPMAKRHVDHMSLGTTKVDISFATGCAISNAISYTKKGLKQTLPTVE